MKKKVSKNLKFGLKILCAWPLDNLSIIKSDFDQIGPLDELLISLDHVKYLISYLETFSFGLGFTCQIRKRETVLNGRVPAKSRW